MSAFNKRKFVFHETFVNTATGKSSGSGFVGVVLGLIAGASFAATIVGYFLQIPETIEVMKQIIALVAISGALLGVRKLSGSFGKHMEEDNNTEAKG